LSDITKLTIQTIAENVGVKAGVPTEKAKEFVNMVFEEIGKIMVEAPIPSELRIRSFGKWTKKMRKTPSGFSHFRTGETVAADRAESVCLTFKTASTMKARIKENVA